MSTVISIQARIGSTRLPGKVLLSLGSHRTIEWIRKRCIASSIDDFWVTTSRSDPDDVIAEWCRRNDVPFVRGPESDLLERHKIVAEKTSAKTLIRINGDCPFVPSAEIDRVLSAHQASDAEYTTNQTGTVPHGINVDIIETKTLQKLEDAGHSHPVTPLRKGEWKTTYTESDAWTGFNSVSLTLDTPDDYWRLVDAVDTVGGEPAAVARHIESGM